MLTTLAITQIYDTILSIPGMNETVKIDLRISRKNVLLLNRVIERGLDGRQEPPGLLENVPEETLLELRALGRDFLQKAGLTELSEKLTHLGSSE